MKQFLSLLLILSITTILNAQSALGNIKLRPEYYQSEMKKKDFEELKNSKAFFVMPDNFESAYTKEDYELMLKQVWNATPIEVITRKQIKDILEIGIIIIRFKSTSYRKTKNFETKMTLGFNYFKFGLVNKIKDNKKGGKRWWEDFFGIISFTADVGVRLDMARMQDTIYGDLLDYRKGFLKNYFQQMNDAIKTSTNHDFYDDVTNKSHLYKLKKQPLFIPENILYRFNALTGKEKERSSSELFKDYKYQFNVVNENELSDMILGADKPFYYLMYHQKNAHKIITIIEALSGKIIYRTSKNMSYNIKPKDIKAIVKSMK